MSLRSWSLMVAMLAAVTSARAADLRTVYYDVVGDTARELRRDLNKKGPVSKRGIRGDGLTEWHVSWKFDYARGPAGCEITNVRSTLVGTITMPRWTPTHKVSPELTARWQRFLTALLVHEHGHYSYGVEAADEIKRMGRSLRASPECSSLGKAFNERGHAIIEKYRAVQEEYDRRTGHGRTQGAIFP